MPITSIKRNLEGDPNIVYIITTENLTQIMTTGYITTQQDALDAINNGPFVFNANDYCLIQYSNGEAFFTVDLTDMAFEETGGGGGSVITPTIANHIALYTDTDGTLSEDAATAINGGNIQAGLSGTRGDIISYPATAASGHSVFRGNANTNSAIGTVEIDALSADTNFHVNPSVITPDLYFVTSSQVPRPYTELVAFRATVNASDLLSGGQKQILLGGGGVQYEILSLNISATGTNFSGGSGDRNIQITDGATINWTIIPAATLASLVNAVWGSTNVPFPVSGGLSDLTAANNGLVASYNGGTNDYTTGQIIITGLAYRIV